MLRSLFELECEALRRHDDFLSQVNYDRLVRTARARANTRPRPSLRLTDWARRRWSGALDTAGLLLEHWGRSLRTIAAA